MNVSKRPYLTEKLPGIGGEIKSEITDFQVEEIPLYQPADQGAHIYLWVEKRGMSSGAAIKALARRFNVPRRDIGTAGIKDKFALTRQWVSLPFSDDVAGSPEEMIGPVGPDLQVLKAQLHQNKLRTGHLYGNRFRVIVRQLEAPGEVALERARAVMEVLKERGLPNFYGPQRFGVDGETLKLGVGLLSGDAAAKKRLRRARRLRRLALSAVQSELFNRVLSHRLKNNLLHTVIEGDVLKKTDTGGTFWVPPEEVADCQARLERGELLITGPMPGAKMFAPKGAAAKLEEEIFAQSGFDVGLFAQEKRLARGTRRPLLVEIGEPTLELARAGGSDMLVLSFSLPSGSYATVLLDEVMKNRSA